MVNKVNEFIDKICEDIDKVYDDTICIHNRIKTDFVRSFGFVYNDSVSVKRKSIDNCSINPLLKLILKSFYIANEETKDIYLTSNEIAERVFNTGNREIGMFFERDDLLKIQEFSDKDPDITIAKEVILSLMKDPFNPTDEELIDFFNGYGQSFLDLYTHLWGERAIDFFAQRVSNMLLDPKSTRNPVNDDSISNEMWIKVLSKLEDKAVKQISYSGLRYFSNSTFYTLIETDPRYLLTFPRWLSVSERGTANKIYENKDYNEVFRTCAIIAECCKNKDLPAYQAAKLKTYAALVKINSFDYLKTVSALLDSVNSGEPLHDKKVKETPTKTSVKMYVLIGSDGSSKLYNSQIERCKDLEVLKVENPTVTYKKGIVEIKDEGE